MRTDELSAWGVRIGIAEGKRWRVAMVRQNGVRIAGRSRTRLNDSVPFSSLLSQSRTEESEAGERNPSVPMGHDRSATV